MPVPRDQFLSNTWKENIFANRVVFCTGGSGSICSAQVRALVYLGANACIVGRNAEKAEKVAKDISTVRPGSVVLGIGNVDVRKIESLQAAVKSCVQELGGIDYVMYEPLFTSNFRRNSQILLLNSLSSILFMPTATFKRAGAAGNFLVLIDDLSANAFKTVVEIDLIGSYNTTKATIPYLLESAAKNKNPGPTTGGRILFLSASFHYTGMPYQTHAACAKAGVDALSASIALEYGPRGITSNVISPGAIKGTEGIERLTSSAARESEAPGKEVPLGRYGLMKEVSDATVYLLGETGNYTNGHVLVVDGGAWRVPGFAGFSSASTYPEVLSYDLKQQKCVKSGREKAKI